MFGMRRCRGVGIRISVMPSLWVVTRFSFVVVFFFGEITCIIWLCFLDKSFFRVFFFSVVISL